MNEKQLQKLLGIHEMFENHEEYNLKGCPAHPDSCFNCPWYKKNNPA
jgi:hypothetical protein